MGDPLRVGQQSESDADSFEEVPNYGDRYRDGFSIQESRTIRRTLFVSETTTVVSGNM